MDKRAMIPIVIACTLGLIILIEIIAAFNGLIADTISGIAWFIVLTAVGLFFYFVPTYVAWVRKHHALLSIFVFNLFLGWTFLGWVGALVWSCLPVRQQLRA